jgi:hypothetical protein
MATKSYCDLFQQWKQLLDGLQATGPHTGAILAIQQVLEASLREASATRRRRERLHAAALGASRKLAVIIDETREATGRARNYLRYRLGPDNEDLTRYGIAPYRRPRARKAAAPAA